MPIDKITEQRILYPENWDTAPKQGPKTAKQPKDIPMAPSDSNYTNIENQAPKAKKVDNSETKAQLMKIQEEMKKEQMQEAKKAMEEGMKKDLKSFEA